MNNEVVLPTEKESTSGFELFENDDSGSSSELRKFSILKTSPTVSPQEQGSTGIQSAHFLLSLPKISSGLFLKNFFYCFSDKRQLIFRYLFPFHTFW